MSHCGRLVFPNVKYLCTTNCFISHRSTAGQCDLVLRYLVSRYMREGGFDNAIQSMYSGQSMSAVVLYTMNMSYSMHSSGVPADFRVKRDNIILYGKMWNTLVNI